MNAADEDSVTGISTKEKENVLVEVENSLCTEEEDINGENSIHNSIYAHCVKKLHCFVCHSTFNSFGSFHYHHLKHVKQPYILLKRIQIDFQRIYSDALFCFAS